MNARLILGLAATLAVMGCEPSNPCLREGTCVPTPETPPRSRVDCTQAAASPVASAGEDFEVTPGGTAHLNASGSLVSPKRVRGYTWALVTVPDGSAASLSDPHTVNPSFVADREGGYTATVTIDDGCRVSGPDSVTVLARNQPPTARAGIDQTVAKRAQVKLDGTLTVDPEGDPVSFAWSFLSRPEGSAAVLSGSDTARPSFTADVAGAYEVELVARDPERASAPDVVKVISQNTAPTVTVANAAPIAERGVAQTFVAVAADADGDPLSFSWTLASTPEGSSAALSDPAAQTPTFTPDLVGTYELRVVASDGTATPPPTVITLTAVPPVPRLSHRVIDAEYSRRLERLVMVSDAPNRLYLYDPETDTETSIALGSAPTSVSVSPDGLFAVVGHDGKLSHVDLTTANVLAEWPVSCNVLDVVLAGDGYAYAFPLRNASDNLRILRLADGVETLSTGTWVPSGALGKLHPAGGAIYGAYHSDLEKYGIGAGSAAKLYDSPYSSEYPVCGNLWFDEPGTRIFTRCGNVFRSSSVKAEDMKFAGALTGTYIRHLDHSAAAKEIAFVQDFRYGSAPDVATKLYLHEDAYLGFTGAIALPRFVAGGRYHPAYGRFVFHSADGSKLYVLAQADAASGLLLDYALFRY